MQDLLQKSNFRDINRHSMRSISNSREDFLGIHFRFIKDSIVHSMRSISFSERNFLGIHFLKKETVR